MYNFFTMLFLDASRYSYTPLELRRCLRSEDFIRFKIDIKVIENTFEEISGRFYTSKFGTGNLMVSNIKGNKIVVTSELYDLITIRRTDGILKRTLQYSVFSRDDEVRQIINLIKTEKSGFAFRCDISKFFESINFKSVIELLREKNFSNQVVIEHLVSISNFWESQGEHGLPRGLPISSTLAEFYLSELDKRIYQIPSVSYYCRYVDDIFVVFSNEVIDMESEISSRLPPGLSLNKKKSIRARIGSKTSIEFLGYLISVENAKEVKVADSKIGKAKRRIVLTFKRFLFENDFPLLISRLQFLAGTTKMKKSGRFRPVLAGFRSVYVHCTINEITDQMKALDTFKQRILFSKRFSLGKNLRSKLTGDQINEITQVSFQAGLLKKMSRHLPPKSIGIIKEAWEYE